MRREQERTNLAAPSELNENSNDDEVKEIPTMPNSCVEQRYWQCTVARIDQDLSSRKEIQKRQMNSLKVICQAQADSLECC